MPNAPEEDDIVQEEPAIGDQLLNIPEQHEVIVDELVITTAAQYIQEEDVADEEKPTVVQEGEETVHVPEETTAPDLHEPVILEQQLFSQELAAPEPTAPPESSTGIAEMAVADSGSEVDLTSNVNEG